MKVISNEIQMQIIDILPDNSTEALLTLAAAAESVLHAMNVDPCTFCGIIQNITAARNVDPKSPANVN